MALPINFTNSLNNRGCKSQGPANSSSSFFPTIVFFFMKPFLKLISSLWLLPFLFPFFHINLYFSSPHLFLSVLPLACRPWPAAPTRLLDLFRYFLVQLTAVHSSVTPFFLLILPASSFACCQYLTL